MDISNKKQMGNEVLFQNPDTSDSITIDKNQILLIRDVANIIINKFNLKSPPIFFTIFKNNPTETQFLEEDDRLDEIIKNKLGNEVPIWWRTIDLDPETLYKLRIDRFIKSGYNLDLIKSKKIMIVGVGLLGTEIALHCATIGFKEITLLDYGNVDWFNIYRQPLFDKKDVFKKKVEVGKCKLEEMGGIKVNAINIEIPNFNSILTEKDKILSNIDKLENLISTQDFIITALDTFSARMVIQILSLAHNKVLINTAAGLIGGIVQIVRPNIDPCIGCGTFYDKNQEIGACTLASFGIPKVISGICIDILLDLAENRSLNFNYLKYNPNYSLETKTFIRSTDCPFCGNNGIIFEYKNGNRTKIIEWLIESD